jgi:hypothetical protein
MWIFYGILKLEYLKNLGGKNMEQSLKDLGRWTGIIGNIIIFTGVISALLGLSLYIIGAIPGVIQIVLGAKLLNVKKYANEAVLFNIEDPSNQISYILTNLSSYFKLEGVLMALSLIVGIVTKVL